LRTIEEEEEEEEEEEYVIDQLRGIAITMIDKMEYKHTIYIITTRKYKCTLLTFSVLFQFRNFAIILKFVKYITPPFLIFP
jgi:hypothetical protein